MERIEQEQLKEEEREEDREEDKVEPQVIHSIWNNKSACQKQYCECYKFNTVSWITAPGCQRNKEAVSFPQILVVMFLSFQAEG